MINWTLKNFEVAKLKDYHKNPRRLSKSQYEHLKQSLTKFGIIDKPVCTQDGRLIGGHQRKRVLKDLAIKTIDCYVPDRELTEQEIEELCIRLNKNQGEWDDDLLANQFLESDLMAWGFEAHELGINIDEVENGSDEPEKKTEPKLCPSCGCPI